MQPLQPPHLIKVASADGVAHGGQGGGDGQRGRGGHWTTREGALGWPAVRARLVCGCGCSLWWCRLGWGLRDRGVGGGRWRVAGAGAGPLLPLSSVGAQAGPRSLVSHFAVLGGSHIPSPTPWRPPSQPPAKRRPTRRSAWMTPPLRATSSACSRCACSGGRGVPPLQGEKKTPTRGAEAGNICQACREGAPGRPPLARTRPPPPQPACLAGVARFDGGCGACSPGVGAPGEGAAGSKKAREKSLPPFFLFSFFLRRGRPVRAPGTHPPARPRSLPY